MQQHLPALIPAWPRSSTNIAYADQQHAAVMPSDTNVSIDAVPCRALRSAAAWNGHADQITTGAATTTRIHCQPGNRDHGNSDQSTDRSLSGMKNTSATISRLRSSLTRASSRRASRLGLLFAGRPRPAGHLSLITRPATTASTSR